MSQKRIARCLALFAALGPLTALADGEPAAVGKTPGMDRNFLLWLETYGDAKGEVFDPMDLAAAQASMSNAKADKGHEDTTSSANRRDTGKTK